MKKLEVICDAVANYHHYWEPESDAYSLRNPGLLPGDTGKRVFSCHRAGYAALLDRVQKYCAQHKEERVEALLVFCGIKMRRQQEEALDFMSRCASNNSLKLSTNLQWFLTED